MPQWRVCQNLIKRSQLPVPSQVFLRTENRELRTRTSVCCRAGRRLFLACLDQLDIQAERLQLADQHVERFGYAGLHGSFALDDGLINLGAAVYVVGLRRQQLLQDERRAISFQRPDFHFSETLSSELRLAAQRLLGDQRVRTDGTRVNLVVHQVRQLQHVDVTNRDRLFELLTGHAVVKSGLARSWQTGVFEQSLDLAFLGTG